MMPSARKDDRQPISVIDPSLMNAEEDDNDEDGMDIDETETMSPQHGPLQSERSLENGKDSRVPVSQAMSISAMLSNPVDPPGLPAMTPDRMPPATKQVRSKTSRKKLNDDHPSGRKLKGRSSVRSSRCTSRLIL